MKARISSILPETSRATRALAASVVVTAAAFVGLVVVLQPPDTTTTADWLNTDAGNVKIHQTIKVIGDENTPTGESGPTVFTNVSNPSTSAALQ